MDVLATNVQIEREQAIEMLEAIKELCGHILTRSKAVLLAASEGNAEALHAFLTVDPGAWCKCDSTGADFPLSLALRGRHYGAAEEIVSHPIPDPGRYVRTLRSHRRANMHHLIVRVVMANVARMEDVWNHVPRKCRGLHAAIPAILSHRPKDMRKLMMRLTREDRSFVMSRLWALQKVHTNDLERVVLPSSMHAKVLSLVLS